MPSHGKRRQERRPPLHKVRHGTGETDTGGSVDGVAEQWQAGMAFRRWMDSASASRRIQQLQAAIDPVHPHYTFSI